VTHGIDGRLLNEHSGAEANVAAGLALLDHPFVLAQAAGWAGAHLSSRKIAQSRISPPPKASRKHTMARPG
jgi:glycine/serine hydroxymethyltransferase